MNQYSIFCTEAQTKKALDLGAPILRRYIDNGQKCFYVNPESEFPHPYLIPTAEEMIGWLEEQGLKFRIYEKFENSWFYYVGHRTRREPIKEFDNLTSRQEATITAIDAALEYLSKNKKQYESK